MKFKVDQFWWTRDETHLLKITKINHYMYTIDIHSNNRRGYYTNGRYSAVGLDPKDLAKQETDPRIIAKYLWGVKDEVQS